MVFGFGGRERPERGGVGEVDAGVPEAVAELPDEELEGVGEGSQLTQLSRESAEIGGDCVRRKLVRGKILGLFDGGLNLGE